MVRLRTPSLFVVVFAFAMVAVVTSAGAFSAHLSGGAQAPPIVSTAQGRVIFQLSSDGSVLLYRLVVANIDYVTQAHLRLASMGMNGPVVVPIFGGPTTTGRTTGVLAQGTITASDLQGPLAGQPLSALINAMQSGHTYVNVQTVSRPLGEIRGQIR